MPQHMRRDPLRPAWQVHARRSGQRRAQGLVADPGRAPVKVAALGAEQRRTRPGVIIVEAAPHILDAPPQRHPGAVDQRHHPLAGPGPAGALALADVHLPNRPRSHFTSARSRWLASLTPQPGLGHQPGRRIAAGRRGELPARRQLRPPPRELPPGYPNPWCDPAARTAYPAGYSLVTGT